MQLQHTVSNQMELARSNRVPRQISKSEWHLFRTRFIGNFAFESRDLVQIVSHPYTWVTLVVPGVPTFFAKITFYILFIYFIYF